jgi:acyl-CoA reductase-like NAD-dependent aldehyde dehydrogenase
LERVVIGNWIDGRERPARSGATFTKLAPATAKPLYEVARSAGADVEAAIEVALGARETWANMTAVRRGEILHDVALAVRQHREEVARVVGDETGKSFKEALGETDAAVAQGIFMAGEGRRLHGHTLTSGVANRHAMTLRVPVGTAALVIAANTPIANVAWKVFPALICGNTAVLKSSEDTPRTSLLFAKLAHDAGLPAGVLGVVQGVGREAGAALVADPRIDVVSFTGSTAVGREIARIAGERLAKVFLELGGKNPFVVCDDADLELAARWAVLSAFSNAGQRCAAGSRLLVFDRVYDAFKELVVAKTRALRVGSDDADDLGPVINQRQLDNMLGAVARARAAGARVLCGGERLARDGFYMAPTLVEDAAVDSEISQTELFGPISCFYRVADFEEAARIANASAYGLTACIHTTNVHRAFEFARRVQAGVVSINAGTYGSEPHFPFGGVKGSGNGLREPGVEALDVYSEWKTVHYNIDPTKV